MEPSEDCLTSVPTIHGRLLRWENEACRFLRTSTDVEDVKLVCSYFPFRYPIAALTILSSRRTENSLTNVEAAEWLNAEECLGRVATDCDSRSWDRTLSLPFASPTMDPIETAKDTDEKLLTLASKLPFMALVKEACGLPSEAIRDSFDGLCRLRSLFEHRFTNLDISKAEYEKVEKELKNPLARWIFATSLRSTSGSSCPSDVLKSLLLPIEALFVSQELTLKSMLQRLKILSVLYEDIQAGLDPRWEGLGGEDFRFLEEVTDNTPERLAQLFMEKDLSRSQKLCPEDFRNPAELRSKSLQWSSLVHTVRVCVKAHPGLISGINEASKILLRCENLFSGMALVYGLSSAGHPPTEWWWTFFTVRHICLAYQVEGWLRGSSNRNEEDAGSKPTASDTKSRRSCMRPFLEITSTLSATLLFRAGQYESGGLRTLDRTPEHKEELSRQEVTSIAGDSWNESSTMVESGLGQEMAPGVENVDGVTSNPVLAALESSVSTSHADDQQQTEIDISPDLHEDSYSDSAIGSDRINSTTTLSSEAFRLVERYGRGYHHYYEDKYLLPNDEQEQRRLDLQHHLFGVTLGGCLHLAPLPTTTQRALDIGTGTGNWPIAFADKYPGVEIYGVDLSPIQPDWVPPNCVFQIDDLSLSWNFDYPFDFIHGRMLFCSFSNPLHVFREAFGALTAGGVFEMQDLIFDFLSPDGSLEGSALEMWSNRVKDAFKSKGIDLSSASSYSNYLEAVGFEELHQQEFIWPVGTWPDDQELKARGLWCWKNIVDLLFAISIVPLTEYQQHSMSEEEIQVLLALVRQDLREQRIHAYLRVVVVHGQKPKPAMEGLRFDG